MTQRIFIVGCGDIGQRLARLWLARGAVVAALTRSAPNAARLRASGIEAVSGDLDQPAALRHFPAADLIYYLAPPPEVGSSDPRMTAFLAAMPDAVRPERFVYISTLGVYGDTQGAWITETAPLQPGNDRSRRRLAAETALAGWARAAGVPHVLLRVGGIYGPGRLPLERLRQGLPVVREDECPPTNRIHADDLAAVCLAAGERGTAGAVYNVADGNPTTMSDYFNRAADLLGVPRPAQISWHEAQRVLTPSMLSFLNESKRIDNRKMREELGVTLRYPDLASGLPSCLDDGAS